MNLKKLALNMVEVMRNDFEIHIPIKVEIFRFNNVNLFINKYSPCKLEFNIAALITNSFASNILTDFVLLLNHDIFIDANHLAIKGAVAHELSHAYSFVKRSYINHGTPYAHIANEIMMDCIVVSKGYTIELRELKRHIVLKHKRIFGDVYKNANEHFIKNCENILGLNIHDLDSIIEYNSQVNQSR